MKKFTIVPFLAMACMICLQSCSIEKRVYMRGYNLEWNHRDHTPESEPAQMAVQSEKPALLPEEAIDPEFKLSASASEEASEPLIVPHKEWTVVEVPEQKAPVVTPVSKVKKFVKTEIAPIVQDARPHPLAIASLVLGILSLVAYYGAFPLGVLAIIFGAMALRRIREDSGSWRGYTMSWWGIILGIVGIAIVLTILII